MNSLDRVTDRPDMTSAVDRGRKASNQTNKQNYLVHNYKKKLEYTDMGLTHS